MKAWALIEALKQMPQDRDVWIHALWDTVELEVVAVDSDGDVAVAERAEHIA
jgi:hypothetical protein